MTEAKQIRLPANQKMTLLGEPGLGSIIRLVKGVIERLKDIKITDFTHVIAPNNNHSQAQLIEGTAMAQANSPRIPINTSV